MPDDDSRKANGKDKDKIVQFVIEQADEPINAEFADEEGQKSRFMDSLTQLQHHQFSVFLRLISAFFMVFCLVLSAILLLAFVIFFGGTLITLGKLPTVKKIMELLWVMMKKALVFSLGFFVGVFNPAFGIGLIILYFTLIGEQMNEEILARILGRNS